MNQLSKNKELVLEYFKAISGVIKTPALVNRYVDDPELRDHIEFFDSVLPRYAIFADEITAEENRVVVRAHCRGNHEGEFKGIPPTYKKVDFAFVICYVVENQKIVHHWMIADMVTFMEQLGVAAVEAV